MPFQRCRKLRIKKFGTLDNQANITEYFSQE
jgi:hypothetical protein